MKTRIQRTNVGRLGAGILLAASMLLWPGAASADDVSVDCGGPGPFDGMMTFGDLQAAIDYLHGVDPNAFHTIEVTGTCEFPRDTDGTPGQDTDSDGNLLWLSFFVRDFANLTIQAPVGETATLSQKELMKMGIYLTQVVRNSHYMLWSPVGRVPVPPTIAL